MCKKSCLQDGTSASFKQSRRRVTFGNINEPPHVSIQTFQLIDEKDHPNVFMTVREEHHCVRVTSWKLHVLVGESSTGKPDHLRPKCRGLERSIGGDYNEEVKKNRRRAIHGVLAMHRTSYSCETIAETYRQRTEASVAFSNMMGRIDAEIARKEERVRSEEHEEGVHPIARTLNEVARHCIQFAVLLRDLTYMYECA